MLYRGIVDLFAAYERLIISARTKAALAAMRRRGERTGAIPFGAALSSDGATILTNVAEQRVVDAVRAMRAPRMSIRAIVVECERRGFR